MIKKHLPGILARVKSFPNMSDAAARLLAILDDPDTTLSQIEEILRFDPGLTVNILRMSNSAYFGFRSRIGSVKQAVVALGINQIKKIAVTSCLSAVVYKPVAGYDLTPGEFLRHSIAVSVAAEGFVDELKLSAGDNIFTAALIHDIGKLILADFVKEDMDKIQDVASGEVSFEAAERLVLGVDHAQVGAMVLDNWSFPPEIVGAVKNHHVPESGDKTSVLTDVVHVADLLCLMIGIGVGRDGIHYEPSSDVIERLRLSRTSLELVASRTLQIATELSDMFG